MTAPPGDHSCRIRAAVTALTVIAAAAHTLALTLDRSEAEVWWPHTGQALADSPRSADTKPCDLIVRPARAACEHGTINSAPTGHHGDAAGAAVQLIPAEAGLATHAMWRQRGGAARQERH
ncbi:hypothetical protein AB0F07_40345 [Streptomyces fructofermentans]|uniref:hypothetical protein n=1 Tax=Streptomyces fructofermentans TaxID=152141 RepID=UPI0033D36619